MNGHTITPDQLQVSLVGKPADKELIQKINSRLEAVEGFNSPGETGELKLHVERISTSIMGSSPKDAALHVEMSTKELPFSPFYITVPLKGAVNALQSINQDLLSRVRFETRAIIVNFCKEIANSYTFSDKIH